MKIRKTLGIGDESYTKDIKILKIGLFHNYKIWSIADFGNNKNEDLNDYQEGGEDDL